MLTWPIIPWDSNNQFNCRTSWIMKDFYIPSTLPVYRTLNTIHDRQKYALGLAISSLNEALKININASHFILKLQLEKNNRTSYTQLLNRLFKHDNSSCRTTPTVLKTFREKIIWLLNYFWLSGRTLGLCPVCLYNVME